MPGTLDLSDFKLSQATLEIRYDNAYTLWDRAGRVWSAASAKWAALKMQQAQPMVTTFILDDRFELTVKIDRSHCIDMKPTSSLKEFLDRAETFVDVVSTSLDITKFTRLGFRLIYNKIFPDKYMAANTLISTSMIAVPQGKHFNIEGRVSLPSYSLLWEGQSVAVRVTLAARDKKIDFEVLPSVEEVSPVHIEKHELVYDIDYYTLGSIAKGQLSVRDWISQAYHLIRRDSKVFMGV